MAYSVNVSGYDLSSGVGQVRVTAVYTWTEVGGPKAVERIQDELAVDFTAAQFLNVGTPPTFTVAGDLAPPPSPAWFIGLRIQEVARVPRDDGWLFRSGRFETDPPTDPIEVVLAREQRIGATELAGSIPALRMTSGSTTLTGLTLMVAGADIALTADGTDTRLPANVSFHYTATLSLIPNGTLETLDEPFEIGLANPSLTFVAGPGGGFMAAILNAVAGIIDNSVTPTVKATVKNVVNTGVMSSIASRLNRGMPGALPAGIVVSVRRVEAATRPLAAGGGTEPVIRVFAALGAFGGVLSKFPPPPTTGGGTKTCFIATAALPPAAAELEILRAWRDDMLRSHRAGRRLIAVYERVSPPLARVIARSAFLRSVVRSTVVLPCARLARRSLQRAARR